MDEASRLAINYADFFPQANNSYVPRCTYVAEGSVAKISFGTPAVANNAGLLAAAAMDLDLAGGETFTTFVATGGGANGIMDARYGRNVTITASADVGAGTAIITVKGFDYLMQPMTETITIANGQTVGTGLKAFKKVTSISHTGVSAAVTGRAGFGDVLGLPYKTVKVLTEELDGAVASLGTLVTPVLTDPQTATTGDPRGTYDPASTLELTKEITILAVFSNEVVSGNGGYHGIKHFSA